MPQKKNIYPLILAEKKWNIWNIYHNISLSYPDHAVPDSPIPGSVANPGREG